MDIRMRIGCVACVACWGMGVAAQPLPPTGGWGLDDVVLQACQSSPDALAARHTFRSAYWDYRSFRADYLPSLTLTSGPNLDRSINQITMEDGSVRFVEQNLLNTDLSLRVQQNVSWTGGTLSLESSLLRTDLLSDRTFSWKSVPVNIGYSQSLFGYNNLKWRRRIEPVRYEEAQRSYLETMELVAARAASRAAKQKTGVIRATMPRRARISLMPTRFTVSHRGVTRLVRPPRTRCSNSKSTA